MAILPTLNSADRTEMRPSEKVETDLSEILAKEAVQLNKKKSYHQDSSVPQVLLVPHFSPLQDRKVHLGNGGLEDVKRQVHLNSEPSALFEGDANTEVDLSKTATELKASKKQSDEASPSNLEEGSVGEKKQAAQESTLTASKDMSLMRSAASISEKEGKKAGDGDASDVTSTIAMALASTPSSLTQHASIGANQEKSPMTHTNTMTQQYNNVLTSRDDYAASTKETKINFSSWSGDRYVLLSATSKGYTLRPSDGKVEQILVNSGGMSNLVEGAIDKEPKEGGSANQPPADDAEE